MSLQDVDLEQKRLRELYSFKLLDTPQDAELDEITKMASSLCETPIALISLIDQNRQWFKSKIGLEISETSRDVSFCEKAISDDEIFIVKNAIQDERFKNNPLVLNEPHIRFYAGYPLKTEKGYNLGTLCVIDKKERVLNENQINILKILSKNVVNYFELNKKKNEIDEAFKSLLKNQKLSLIANLSSRMTHDISNPLSIILNITKLMEDKIDNEEEIDIEEFKNFSSKIEKASLRIADSIRTMRLFSQRSEKESYKISYFKELIKNVIILFQKKMQENSIDFIMNEFPDFVISCKPMSLAHAFYNIILNLYDEVLNLEEKWIKINVEMNSESKNMTITCSNSSKGISEEIIDNIINNSFYLNEVIYLNLFGIYTAKKIIEEHSGQFLYDKNSINNKYIIIVPCNHKTGH
ncbi:GAF domain-containing protein [Silvanigrella aquatica]|uniref:histidine kinase n=1 Tax=Silvanigrella aquatica TaxID=1915309 RepID=A0A1L4CXQ4_9BACT|nr:GAF domain-containing protein [Silvanigrella aquatica]APJ02727.1 hypothetical protein AXG55_01810 [Silvanigrella aquatica]